MVYATITRPIDDTRTHLIEADALQVFRSEEGWEIQSRGQKTREIPYGAIRGYLLNVHKTKLLPRHRKDRKHLSGEYS
ncbi:MAG: hypothetical protein ACI8Y7_000579 [Candidatus Woesearchaeota archaeon]|jgi:hypothetical protein